MRAWITFKYINARGTGRRIVQIVIPNVPPHYGCRRSEKDDGRSSKSGGGLRENGVNADERLCHFYDAHTPAECGSAQVDYSPNEIVIRRAYLQKAAMGVVLNQPFPVLSQPVFIRRALRGDVYGDRVVVHRHNPLRFLLFFFSEKTIRPRIIDFYIQHLTHYLGGMLSVKKTGG